MFNAQVVNSRPRPAIQVRPDFDRVEVGTTHFMPSANWASESISAYERIVQMRGLTGNDAQQLIETYRILAYSTFEPIMSQYRALVEKLLDQDTARDHLIEKLVKATVPMPDTKEELTAGEVLACLEDFEEDEAHHLKKENTFGNFLTVTAPILKTGVAWPFFATILENTGYNGVIPTIGGLLLAATAGGITSGLLLLWMRTLMGLIPSKEPMAFEPEPKGKSTGSDGNAGLRRAFSVLHPSRQINPIANVILFMVTLLALVFLWNQWRVVDFFTFTSRFHVPSETAQSMSSTLVTLLMGAGLLGAYYKHNATVGKRRVKEVRRLLQQWMADEIAALSKCEVDIDTYNQICSRWSWACTKVQQIALTTLWIDPTKTGAVLFLKKELLGLEAASKPPATKPEY